MAIIWCLLLFAAGCAAAREPASRNVFPPYKPIFSPEVWKEIQELLNLTKRDSPPLFDAPLTHEQTMQLIKDYNSQYENFIGPWVPAPDVDGVNQLLLNPANRRQEIDPELAALMLELSYAQLTYDQILAMLGEYTKANRRHEIDPELAALMLELSYAQLTYDQILAILGEYIKG